MIVCTHTAATSGRADGGATGEISSGHEEKTRGRSSDGGASLLLAKEYLALEILRDAALALLRRTAR